MTILWNMSVVSVQESKASCPLHLKNFGVETCSFSWRSQAMSAARFTTSKTLPGANAKNALLSTKSRRRLPPEQLNDFEMLKLKIHWFCSIVLNIASSLVWSCFISFHLSLSDVMKDWVWSFAGKRGWVWCQTWWVIKYPSCVWSAGGWYKWNGNAHPRSQTNFQEFQVLFQVFQFVSAQNFTSSDILAASAFKASATGVEGLTPAPCEESTETRWIGSYQI